MSDEQVSRDMWLCAEAHDVPGVLRKLNAGADVNVTDEFGRTALLVAASTGSLEVVKVLIAFGADPSLADSEGVAPILAARRNQQPHIVYFLNSAAAKEMARGFLHDAVSDPLTTPSDRRPRIPAGSVPGRVGSLSCRRVALVIANSHYQYQSVHNAISDAQLVSRRLEQLRFEVFVGVNLPAEQMYEDFMTFKSNLTPDDLAVFYFVGLGARQFGGSERRSSLLGTDRKFQLAPDNVPTKGLTVELVVEQLAERRGSHGLGPSLLILDTCQDFHMELPKGFGSQHGATGWVQQTTHGGAASSPMPRNNQTMDRSRLFAPTPKTALAAHLNNPTPASQKVLLAEFEPNSGGMDGHGSQSSLFCKAAAGQGINRGQFEPGIFPPDVSNHSNFAVLLAHRGSETLNPDWFEPLGWQQSHSLLRPQVQQIDFLQSIVDDPSVRATQRIADNDVAKEMLGMPQRPESRSKGVVVTGLDGVRPRTSKELMNLSNRCAFTRNIVSPLPGADWPGVVDLGSTEGARGVMCREDGPLELSTDAPPPSLFAVTLESALGRETRLKDVLLRTAAGVLESSKRAQKPCTILGSEIHKVLL